MTAEFISVEALARPEHHYFLSPHYDDIALSCGGTAALLAENGRIPEILLIFGDHPYPDLPLTPFATQMHQQWGMDAAGVIAGRRAEEALASGVIGASDRYLPFRDAIYRGENYLNDDELFGATKDVEAVLPGEIALAIGAEPESARFYAPLAIGNHVDHQHAFQVGMLLAAAGREVWFYEDLPYALKHERVESRVGDLPEALTPTTLVDVSTVWEKKIEAIMAYASQLAVIFGYVAAGSSREAINTVMYDYSVGVGNGIAAERFWESSVR